MQAYVSGGTPTTQIGFVNRNQQRCKGQRGIAGTDHGQYAYRMECLVPGCRAVYGANGTDVFLRKCPACQDGATGFNSTVRYSRGAEGVGTVRVGTVR